MSFNELNGNKTIKASHLSTITETSKKPVSENIKTAAQPEPSESPTKELTPCFVNLNQNENANDKNKNEKSSEEAIVNGANYLPNFSDLQRKQLDEQLRNVNIFFNILFKIMNINESGMCNNALK